MINTIYGVINMNKEKIQIIFIEPYDEIKISSYKTKVLYNQNGELYSKILNSRELNNLKVCDNCYEFSSITCYCDYNNVNYYKEKVYQKLINILENKMKKYPKQKTKIEKILKKINVNDIIVKKETIYE